MKFHRKGLSGTGEFMNSKNLLRNVGGVALVLFGTVVVTSTRTVAQTKRAESQDKNARPPADVATSQPRDEDPEPRREPSYAEILKELQKETRSQPRVITPPIRPGGQRRSIAPPSRGSADGGPAGHAKLLPDGSRLVDRPGRLTREGDYFTFSFEDRGQGAPPIPIRLLPNRLLEDMEIISAGGTKLLVFVVSGEVTEYRGVNYLLIQKLLVRPNLGNFK